MRAKEVWKALNLEEEVKRACNEDRLGSVTLEHLVCVKPNQVQSDELTHPDLAAVAAWYIWWQRRQVVNGDHVQSPERTVVAIRVLVKNYSRAKSSKYKPKSTHKWMKPLHGLVKINVDASFSAETMT
jgi:hypothetical protein